jgi:hypothetical protein
MPAIIKTQNGIPELDAGPAVAPDGEIIGSETVAPQLAQNFWDENSRVAPHFGQNLRSMIV